MKVFFCSLIFQLFLLSLFAQTVPTPFAKYSFDARNYQDDIGNVNGRGSGSLSFVRNRLGQPQTALRFSDRSAVSFGDHFDLFSTPDAQFSFSIWIKNERPEAKNVLFLSKYGNSHCNENQREFFVRFNDERKIEFLFYSDLNSATFNGFESKETYADTCWHHLVINYDGSIDTNNGLDRVEMYIDGQRIETQKSATQSGRAADIQNSTSHLSLGTPVGSDGNICFPNSFVGRLDDLAFYDVLLTAEQVRQLFLENNDQATWQTLNAFFSQILNSTYCDRGCVRIGDLSQPKICTTINEWTYEGGTLVEGTPEYPELICYPEAGKYTITHIIGNEFLRDTFERTVTVRSRDIDLFSQNFDFCNTYPREIGIARKDTTMTFLWSTGSTEPTTTVSRNGTYWVEVTENGCTVRDSVEVTFHPNPPPPEDLENFYEICEGQELMLDAYTDWGERYLWRPDSTTAPQFTVTQPGVYDVEIHWFCGTLYKRITVSNRTAPELSVDLGSDLSFCEDINITLDATDPGAVEYQWNTGATTPSIAVNDVGTYAVTLSNSCYEVSDEVTFTRGEKCCELYTPNIFSPNGDGINDYFQAETNCSPPSFLMKIFDRWGNQVFESNDITRGWNGRFRGEPLPKSVYTWFIRYDDGSGEQIKSGTVTLVR